VERNTLRTDREKGIVMVNARERERYIYIYRNDLRRKNEREKHTQKERDSNGEFGEKM
jgi:hypothetical protein